jgi:glycosyltransferase involved in cell wall biosynthesis
MENLKPVFSILITTKNRHEDLRFTLEKINYLIERIDVECIICDDGSTDGTFEYLKSNYPKIQLIQNQKSKGLIYSRNVLLSKTTAKYAISLDDDANFLSQNPLEEIENHFNNNPSCGLIAFRIFWGLQLPLITNSEEKSHRVKGFVGCGHAWRLDSWKKIPNYPDWFIFYGEEDFASYQLFKEKLEVHYLPTILTHHRVSILDRKKNSDYQLRQRRSLRSGWYLFFLFHPWSILPRQLVYSLWMQIKNKTLKGDYKATLGILQAIGDVIINFPKLLGQNNRLTCKEYSDYQKLPKTILYWKPEDEK